jgi:hypothetical protein
VNAYERAVQDVTPLQARVLGALSVEPQPLAEVVDRTAIRDLRSIKGNSRRLDPISTRNALGFLAVKGLAARDSDGAWRRTEAAAERRPRRAQKRRLITGGRTPSARVLP